MAFKSNFYQSNSSLSAGGVKGWRENGEGRRLGRDFTRKSLYVAAVCIEIDTLWAISLRDFLVAI